MFLTVWTSASKRKSLHDSAGMYRAASLMLFSTGFGFRGLARTSPRFFMKFERFRWAINYSATRYRSGSRHRAAWGHEAYRTDRVSL